MSEHGRWKDYLLKSSLPLEQVVRRELAGAGVTGLSAFSYLRPNEQGIVAEFSVDVWGTLLIGGKQGYWGALDALVECKYNYPGVRWVFRPHDKGSLVITGCVSVGDELTSVRVKSSAKSLYSLEQTLSCCARGVEIHSSGCDGNSIQRGLSQLRYAMLNMIAMSLRNQVQTWHDEDLYIQFVVPIFVTTADLWVLRPEVSIDDIQAAQELDEVAVEVPALVHYEKKTPDLEVYAAGIEDELVKRYPAVLERIQQIRGLTREDSSHLPVTFEIDHRFESAGQNILVVTLRHFAKVIRRLKRDIGLVHKDLERLGRLQADFSAKKAEIIPA
jgi:hypothetical protein